MVRLQDQLKYFISKKISTDRIWKKVRVVLSGHEVRACVRLFFSEREMYSAGFQLPVLYFIYCTHGVQWMCCLSLVSRYNVLIRRLLHAVHVGYQYK